MSDHNEDHISSPSNPGPTEQQKPAPSEASKKKSPTPKRKTTRRGAKVDAGTIRRVVERTLQVTDAPGADVATLAALLGAKGDDPLTLMLALAASDGAAVAAVDTIIEMAEMEPMECGVTAAAMERSEARQLWSALESIGALSGNPPGVDVQAAMEMAKAIMALEEGQKKSLIRAAVLADF